MTTAHRPTFKPALGGSEQGGNKMMTHTRSFSARELPAYLELKVRKPGQGTEEEIKKINFKEDLIKREIEGTRQKELKALGVSETSLAVTAGDKDIAEPQILKKIKPSNFQEDSRFPQDANDEMFMKSSDEEDDRPKKNGFQSSGEENPQNRDSDDDDDDDEELLREFQKIKEQREIEERRRFQEKQEEIDRNKEEEILKGNPLVAGEDYSLKKKWFEDTIFRNQSRLEKKDKQRFINDAVRSDFHRKFLNKYILM